MAQVRSSEACGRPVHRWAVPKILDKLWEEIDRKFHELKSSQADVTVNHDLWASYTEDHPYMSTVRTCALNNLECGFVLFCNASDIRDDEKLLDQIYNSCFDLVCKVLAADSMSPPLSHLQYHPIQSCLGVMLNICHNAGQHIPEMRRPDFGDFGES